MTTIRPALQTGGTLLIALLAFATHGGAQTPPPPTLITLVNFVRGYYPYAGVAIGRGPNGQPVLYGTTLHGLPSTYGSVFSLTQSLSGSWTEHEIYNFPGGAYGGWAYAGVVIGKGGVLYGTTYHGGTGPCPGPAFSGCGIVFSLTPPAFPGDPWNESVLHQFHGRRRP